MVHKYERKSRVPKPGVYFVTYWDDLGYQMGCWRRLEDEDELYTLYKEKDIISCQFDNPQENTYGKI